MTTGGAEKLARRILGLGWSSMVEPLPHITAEAVRLIEEDRNEARAARASETERREEAERLRQSAWDEGFKDGQVRAERRCEDLRGALADMVSGMPDHCTGSRGNAPGHGHRVPGIWDDDNGAKAGTACEWCATWQRAVALSAALSGASSPTAAETVEEAGARYLASLTRHLADNRVIAAARKAIEEVKQSEASEATPTEPAACCPWYEDGQHRGCHVAPEPAAPCSRCAENQHERCGGPESGCGCAAANHYPAPEPAAERGSGEVLGTCEGRLNDKLPHPKTAGCVDWTPAPSPGTAGRKGE